MIFEHVYSLSYQRNFRKIFITKYTEIPTYIYVVYYRYIKNTANVYRTCLRNQMNKYYHSQEFVSQIITVKSLFPSVMFTFPQG